MQNVFDCEVKRADFTPEGGGRGCLGEVGCWGWGGVSGMIMFNLSEIAAQNSHEVLDVF